MSQELTGVPTVRILRRVADAIEDRTSDFPDIDPVYTTLEIAAGAAPRVLTKVRAEGDFYAISLEADLGGSASPGEHRVIRFWLGPAQDAAQPEGRYSVEAIFETAEGRKPAGKDRRGGLPPLQVVAA